MAVNNQTTIEPRAMILKNWSSIILTRKKTSKPDNPSAIALTVPPICGLIYFRMLGGTGSQSSSTEEWLIVNLKV